MLDLLHRVLNDESATAIAEYALASAAIGLGSMTLMFSIKSSAVTALTGTIDRWSSFQTSALG